MRQTSYHTSRRQGAGSGHAAYDDEVSTWCKFEAVYVLTLFTSSAWGGHVHQKGPPMPRLIGVFLST